MFDRHAVMGLIDICWGYIYIYILLILEDNNSDPFFLFLFLVFNFDGVRISFSIHMHMGEYQGKLTYKKDITVWRYPSQSFIVMYFNFPT